MDKKTVISSLAYRFLDRLAAKGLGLVISVLLARLLTPDDFGQVALLTVFISLSLVIIESGLNTALIQNKDVRDEDYSTVFHISMLLAILLIIGLYLAAPAIAKYYESDALVLPLRVYAFSLLFAPFNSVQMAKVQREMRFKNLMICSLAATICSGIVGVVLAWLRTGIWALVLYYFSHTVFTCVFMEIFFRWRPRFVFSAARAKVLVGYGWKILASGLLAALYNDIRTLVIGKKFSEGDLGYYDRGQQIPQVLATTMDSAIQSVMLPVFSAVQTEKSKMRAIVYRAVSLGMMLVTPALVGLAAVSESVVLVLLTEKWLPCVIFMRIFCLAEIRTTMVYSNLAVIKALGRSDIFMKLEFARRAVMLIILAISVICFDSVLAIAVGYLISAWIDVAIVTIPVKKLLGYGFLEQMKDNWKTFAASFLMGAVVMLFSGLPIPALFRLVIQIVAGILVYVGLCIVLKAESFQYALQNVKTFMKK